MTPVEKVRTAFFGLHRQRNLQKYFFFNNRYFPGHKIFQYIFSTAPSPCQQVHDGSAGAFGRWRWAERPLRRRERRPGRVHQGLPAEDQPARAAVRKTKRKLLFPSCFISNASVLTLMLCAAACCILHAAAADFEVGVSFAVIFCCCCCWLCCFCFFWYCCCCCYCCFRLLVFLLFLLLILL